MKNSKTLKIVICSIPVIFLLLVGVAMAVSNLFNQSNVPELEEAYKAQMEVLEKTKAALCLTETALAKAKLLDHYDGRTALEADQIEKLTQKAQGQNLNCKGF